MEDNYVDIGVIEDAMMRIINFSKSIFALEYDNAARLLVHILDAHIPESQSCHDLACMLSGTEHILQIFAQNLESGDILCARRKEEDQHGTFYTLFSEENSPFNQ